jgi:rod shape-determining protein MreC
LLPWLLTTALSIVLILSTRDNVGLTSQGQITDLVSVGSYPISAGVKVFALWSENSRLRRELTDLKLDKSHLGELKMENDRLRSLLEFRLKSNLELTAAEVVGFTSDEGVRGLIIKRGYVDGISTGQAVITPDGLVGRVYRVHESSSIVQLLDDPNLGVAAKLSRGSETGIIHAAPNGNMRLQGVPLSAEAALGDSVVTSGEGGVFPSGLMIGSCVKVSPSPEGWLLYVDVKPSVDKRRLEEVFVIRSTYVNE